MAEGIAGKDGCTTGELRIQGRCTRVSSELSFFDKKAGKKTVFFYNTQTHTWTDEKGNTADPADIEYKLDKYAEKTSIQYS